MGDTTPPIMTTTNHGPLEIRELILNTKKPLILRNFQTTNNFHGSLAEWCEKFDAVATGPSEFERMRRRGSIPEPQWERRREVVRMTAGEFLQQQKYPETADSYWTAMNYKRASEIPVECRAGVNFECLGFAQTADDCSYWLGAAGANTPCHYDTYGCNIVCQIYGRKSWLLLPPDAPLTSTRIPYEESSVYCKENFYAPSERQLKDLQKLQNVSYRCVLEPKDVLIVPRGWWHYVEALETSLSVNYWIPLAVDLEAQLEECIVKYLIESFVKADNETTAKYLLNPNQLLEMADDAHIFAVFEHLLKTVKTVDHSVNYKKSQNAFDYQYLTQEEFQVLLQKIPHICEIPIMAKSEFGTFISENAKRFVPNCEASKETVSSPLNALKEVLINSICSPHTIRQIKNEFVERYKHP